MQIRYTGKIVKIRKSLNVSRDTICSTVWNSGYTSWMVEKENEAIKGCNQISEEIDGEKPLSDLQQETEVSVCTVRWVL